MPLLVTRKHLLLLLCLQLVAFTCSKKKSGKRKYKYDAKTSYEMKGSYNLSDVQRDFEKEFQGYAEPMLCSACKLSAAQLAKQISSQSEALSEDLDSAMKAVVRAWNETCPNLPQPLVGVPGERGPEFKALEDVQKEDAELAQRAKPNARSAFLMAGRACSAILYDFREPLFREVQQAWVQGLLKDRRWERLLCGLHGKLCKLQTLAEDFVEVEDGVDSVTKRREAKEEEEKRQAAIEAVEGRKKKVAEMMGAMGKMKDVELAAYIENLFKSEL